VTAGQGYPTGRDYAAHLERLAATGKEMHGEAHLCARLQPPPARILDAGCGTGRVVAFLATLGYDCVGTDLDSSMLEIARQVPGVAWIEADLVALDLAQHGVTEPFDLVVSAGNVVPLVQDPAAALNRMAAHLRPGGLLVAGFGLARTHLPTGAAVLALADYDAWCAAAGLTLRQRFATWDGEPYADGPYAVSVFVRA